MTLPDSAPVTSPPSEGVGTETGSGFHSPLVKVSTWPSRIVRGIVTVLP